MIPYKLRCIFLRRSCLIGIAGFAVVNLIGDLKWKGLGDMNKNDYTFCLCFVAGQNVLYLMYYSSTW